MITIYGLKNCDTCKKALTMIAASDQAHVFVDIRAEADLADRVPVWLEAVGGKALVNTRSTTWRGLSDAEKTNAQADPAPVLIANPTLIKRPVIERDGQVTVGWTPATQAAILGVSAG